MTNFYNFYKKFDREDEPYITFDRDEFLTFLQLAEGHLGRSTKHVFYALPEEVRL